MEISKKKYLRTTVLIRGIVVVVALFFFFFLSTILVISTLARLKKPTAFVDQTKVVVKRDSGDTTLKTYETVAFQI